MALPLSNARIGVYVDGQSASLTGGHGMRYDVLREFAMRDGAEITRMNVYLPWDEQRALEGGYRRGQDNFAATLRDFGYKVVRRPVSTVTDEAGGQAVHANIAVAMAVDALEQTEHVERVLLLTADPDFAPVIRLLQARGIRVELVAFDGVPEALRAEADTFVSGYLIPNLLPIPHQDRDAWGKLGSRVRGVCYNHIGKGYGFLRYLRELAPGLWITDSRHPDSPFETVFFHDSQLPRQVAFHQLPSREYIFEFELKESERFEGDLQAVALRLVGSAARRDDEDAGTIAADGNGGDPEHGEAEFHDDEDEGVAEEQVDERA
jgi:uncharacterized LabA/DUF88 family protein